VSADRLSCFGGQFTVLPTILTCAQPSLLFRGDSSPSVGRSFPLNEPSLTRSHRQLWVSVKKSSKQCFESLKSNDWDGYFGIFFCVKWFNGMCKILNLTTIKILTVGSWYNTHPSF
jgi:hypothetical protein